MLYSEIGCPFLSLLVIYVGRTFRDNDDVGGSDSFRKVAESAYRKEVVLECRSVVIHQHYGEIRLDGSVLERVVKYNDVRFGKIFVYAPAIL